MIFETVNTDPNIESMLARWDRMSASWLQKWIANYDRALAAGEITQAQYDQGMDPNYQDHYYGACPQYGILDGYIYFPNDRSFTKDMVLYSDCTKRCDDCIPGVAPDLKIQVEGDHTSNMTAPLQNWLGVNTEKYQWLERLPQYSRGKLSLFQLDTRPDGRMRIMQIYNEDTRKWRRFTEYTQKDGSTTSMMYRGIAKPMLVQRYTLPVQINLGEPENSTMQLMSVNEAVDEIITKGPFKKKTHYILIGDEPTPAPGDMVVDLSAMLSDAEIKDMKLFFKHMPRQILRDFFMKKIWPDLPWSLSDVVAGIKPAPGVMHLDAEYVEDPIYGGGHYKKNTEDMVWAAFIELFNEANLAYINQNQIEPWVWEQEKLDAYTLSQNQEALDQLQADVDQEIAVAQGIEPQAVTIMEAYMQLPRLGDTGLEISRQNAVKELIKMKAYTEAQAVVDAYRYAMETIVGEQLTKPIPMDVVNPQGNIVIKATT